MSDDDTVYDDNNSKNFGNPFKKGYKFLKRLGYKSKEERKEIENQIKNYREEEKIYEKMINRQKEKFFVDNNDYETKEGEVVLYEGIIKSSIHDVLFVDIPDDIDIAKKWSLNIGSLQKRWFNVANDKYNYTIVQQLGANIGFFADWSNYRKHIETLFDASGANFKNYVEYALNNEKKDASNNLMTHYGYFMSLHVVEKKKRYIIWRLETVSKGIPGKIYTKTGSQDLDTCYVATPLHYVFEDTSLPFKKYSEIKQKPMFVTIESLTNCLILDRHNAALYGGVKRSKRSKNKKISKNKRRTKRNKTQRRR
jgi:hypothetical protein